MKISRLVELSLYYKVQDLLSAKKTGESLSTTNQLSYKLKYPNVISTRPIVVYVNGIDATVSTSGYEVDCINGVVTFNSANNLADAVTIDYYYCTFNIYDESSNAIGNTFKYPAIALYESNANTSAFELGGGNRERTIAYVIEVWSERGGERNDVTDSLMEMLEGNLAIVDFNNGFPTNTNGTINSSYNQQDIITYASTDSINYLKGGSLDIGDKPKYFTEIFADLKIHI